MLDLRQVALRYVFTWFFIDILASLPLELIGLMSGGSLANSDAGAGLQFLQLLKIARLTRIRRMIQKWAAFSGASILQVISVIFGWLLLAHYAACIWCDTLATPPQPAPDLATTRTLARRSRSRPRRARTSLTPPRLPRLAGMRSASRARSAAARRSRRRTSASHPSTGGRG